MVGRRWRAEWLALLGVVLVDLLVRGPFYDDFIVGRFVRTWPMLRERTGGRCWRVVFDALDRERRPELRVAVVGDSTMNATEVFGVDENTPPWLIREALRRRLPGVDLDLVDVSELGLFANDVTLLVNKLLRSDVDLIVYGLTLRALPSVPNLRWATQLGYELTPSELARIGLVGGAGWLRDGLTGPEVIAGSLQSVWTTYAYRALLKRWVHNRLAVRVFSRWPALVKATKPTPLFAPMIAPPPVILPGRVEWSREGYAIPNSNWTALELLGRLCQRHAPDRCLIYSGPINPRVRDRLADPGLYEEYLAQLRIVAGRHDLRFRDYTDLLSPSEFRPPMYPRSGEREPLDPIHMNRAGATRLADHLADALADMAAPILAGNR